MDPESIRFWITFAVLGGAWFLSMWFSYAIGKDTGVDLKKENDALRRDIQQATATIAATLNEPTATNTSLLGTPAVGGASPVDKKPARRKKTT